MLYICVLNQTHMKKIFWIELILFFIGIYLMGFGIFTLTNFNLLSNGITLICLGWLVSCFSIVSFLERKFL